MRILQIGICSFLIHSFFFAQSLSENDITLNLQKLRKIFDSSQVYLQNGQETSHSDTSLISFLAQLETSNTFAFDRAAYFAATEKKLKREIGISYSIDALQNFNPSQQDLEDNILYQRRMQNGIEWNILKDGFLDARNEHKYLPLEQAYQEELAKFQYSKKDIPLKMNQTIYWFNLRKEKLINQRVELLEKQKKIIELLFFAKKLPKDFILKNQTRLAEIQAMKGIYNAYNEYISPITDSVLINGDAPLFDLNYEKLMLEVNQKSNVDSLTTKMIQELENQNKWFNEIRFKTYLRHSYYDLISLNPSGRAFFSAGFSANIPLSFTHKEQNLIEKEKLNKQIEYINQVSENKRIELLNEAYEYRYQLKQYIIFNQKKVGLFESIRQERVKAKLQDADFNPLHALELIDDLLHVEIELLDLKQNLYIRLLKIHEKTNLPSIGELILPLKLPNFIDFEDETQRNIYIWSKSFEIHSVEFISEYILYNQFDEVQMAISQEDNFLKEKIALINELNSKGIKVDLMLGQNSLLDSKNFSKDLGLILKGFPLEKVNAIHLDIEPHTRDDWKSKQENLKLAYKNIIKETKSYCSTYNLKLTIDIPIILDSSYTNELIQSVDLVRFMCYENIREEYLLRKLNPYLKFKDKISFSLRTEDFTSRTEMEEFAKKLSNSTEIKIINFHDLNRLIELDKKSLDTDEKH